MQVSIVSVALFLLFPVVGVLRYLSDLQSFANSQTACSLRPMVTLRWSVSGDFFWFVSVCLHVWLNLRGLLQGMEFWQTVGSDFASHLKYNSFISVGRSYDTSCRNKSRLTRNSFLEMSEVTVDYREVIIAKIGEYYQ